MAVSDVIGTWAQIEQLKRSSYLSSQFKRQLFNTGVHNSREPEQKTSCFWLLPHSRKERIKYGC